MTDQTIIIVTLTACAYVAGYGMGDTQKTRARWLRRVKRRWKYRNVKGAYGVVSR